MYSRYTFGRWAPDPTDMHSSHSNYFQMLGEHGWPGLFLFLLVLFLAWRAASDVIRRTKFNKELHWARDLCAMVQVSLIGYCVGGAFVNLGYFDLTYFLIGLVVLTRAYVYKVLNVDAPKTADPRGKAYAAKPRQQEVRDLRPGLAQNR
jgi:putative inorganic carbon (hco3(-)) transporter